MKLFQIEYSNNWKDASVESGTHNHTRLVFVVMAKKKSIALLKLAVARPDLNSEKFTAVEIWHDVYLAKDESFDA